MRIAFIGLSGPLAYCYKKPSEGLRVPPNPILEDSLGLLILYDQLLFLSPELCPENMRDLPYVRFLSQAAEFADKVGPAIERARSIYAVNDDRNRKFQSPFSRYEPALCAVTKQPFRVDPKKVKFVPDNHGRGFELAGGVHAMGSSAHLQNVIADWCIREAFALDEAEVVSNSANSVYYEKFRPPVSARTGKVAVGHAIVLRGLPNYLDRDGPYHPCLEELRNHPFIEEARMHLDEVVGHESKREVDSLAAEIMRVARRTRREVFHRYMAKRSEYKTIAVAGLTEAIGTQLPGVGFLKEMITARTAEAEAAAVRWSGFVADAAEGDWTRERLL